jgi:F-type H+-transporting ATPase subunit delta
MTDALASHYAEALADAVFQPKAGIAPAEAVKQLGDAVGIFSESEDLRRVLLSPAVPRNRKAGLVGQLLDKEGLHRLIRNFLMVIVEHRRISELERIKDSFEQAVDARQGLVRAEITSAQELTEAQRREIVDALSKAAGKQIRPVYKLDPAILGGVIARFGSKEFDGSLTGRLEAMRRRLSPAS